MTIRQLLQSLQVDTPLHGYAIGGHEAREVQAGSIHGWGTLCEALWFSPHSLLTDRDLGCRAEIGRRGGGGGEGGRGGGRMSGTHTHHYGFVRLFGIQRTPLQVWLLDDMLDCVGDKTIYIKQSSSS